MNIKQRRIGNSSIFVLLSLVLLLATLVVNDQMVKAGPQAQSVADTAALVVTGSYAGSVTVSEPAPLGALDLVLNIADTAGALSGQVDATKTQVFLGGPSFTGVVTATQGLTPTFRIDSAAFTGLVSGRQVQRQFRLTGEISNNADTLRGQYTETIIGFTPHPLLVKGKFLLVRPNGSQVVPTPPVTPGTVTPTATSTATATATTTPATATPTATATQPGNPGQGAVLVYVPLIINSHPVASSADAAAAQLEPALIAEPTPTPTATPTVVEQVQNLSATDNPASPEREHTIFLPVVTQ